VNEELFYADDVKLHELQKQIAAFELDDILISCYLANDEQ
jgi:hypothetical protein